MNIQVLSGSIDSASSDCLVVFSSQDGKGLTKLRGKDCGEAEKLVAACHSEGRFKGAAKESVFFRGISCCGFKHVLVIGLGDKTKINNESFRVAASVAAKNLQKEKINSATLCVESFSEVLTTPEECGRSLSEGLVMSTYKYDAMKSSKKDEKKPSDISSFTLFTAEKALARKLEEGVNLGQILGEMVCFGRDLGNTPGNILTPTNYADRVKAACKGLPIKFQALNKSQIQKLKMGCFLGVNQGSFEEPRFMILEYNGGKKSDKPIVFVGKGITFDTGGISLKPSASMEDMKFDMSGSGAVISATLAIAKLKLKVNLVTLVPSTDNMPDGKATRPGDIHTAMNGKTVEVNNTDAEGRLILSDALAYACENYKPAFIIDVATLTGAVVIALGNIHAGIFCKDEKFLSQIKKASEGSNEKVWQLPLFEEHVEDMKGVYADLTNASSAKGGGSNLGAAFLSQFVEEGVPWAHLDIAGVAYHTGGRLIYNPDKGASGYGVRLLTQLAINHA